MTVQQYFFILMLGLSLTMTACEHYKPMDFPFQNGEQSKPGLLSGKKGYFELPLGHRDIMPSS